MGRDREDLISVLATISPVDLEEPYRTRILKFVEALESGEYTQIQDMLKNDNGHCCLGVACEKYLEENQDLSWYRDEDGDYAIGDSSIELPKQVRDYYEVTEFVWLGDGARNTLAELNDCGYSFLQIAEVIRHRYCLGERVVDTPQA